MDVETLNGLQAFVATKGFRHNTEVEIFLDGNNFIIARGNIKLLILDAFFFFLLVSFFQILDWKLMDLFFVKTVFHFKYSVDPSKNMHSKEEKT